jgi:transposase-like protein
LTVSDLCEELALQPTVFYRWQKEFFENGAAAFQAPERPRPPGGGETETD